VAKSSRFAYLVLAIKLTILVGIVYWLGRNFPREHWDTLVSTPKNWLGLSQAFGLVLTAVLVTFWRWMLLVRSLGVPISLPEAVRLGFLGSLLNQISIGSVGGDLFKAIEAARRSEGKRTEVVTSVLVDRAMGLLGLLIVASLALLTAKDLPPLLLDGIRWVSLAASCVGTLGLLVIVALPRPVPKLAFRRWHSAGQHAIRFLNACMVFRGQPRLLLEVTIASIVVHILLTLSCVITSRSLFSEYPTVREHFQTIPPAVAAATLPITPGGIGVQEAAIDTLFRQRADLPKQFSPLILAIFFRGMLLSSTLVGIVYYIFGFGSRRHRSQEIQHPS
jgi:glycosyltransferase 2 family protein